MDQHRRAHIQARKLLILLTSGSDFPPAWVSHGRPADLCDLRVTSHKLCGLLTVLLGLAQPGAHAGFGADGHHGLSDALLPAVAHLPPDARRRQDRVVQAAIILPHIVDHDGSDQLEAVRLAGLRKMAEVLGRLHLKDLRERDLLHGQMKISGLCSSVCGSNILTF